MIADLAALSGIVQVSLVIRSNCYPYPPLSTQVDCELIITLRGIYPLAPWYSEMVLDISSRLCYNESIASEWIPSLLLNRYQKVLAVRLQRGVSSISLPHYLSLAYLLCHAPFREETIYYAISQFWPKPRRFTP